MDAQPRKPLPFWLDYLKVMGIDVAIVLLAGLLFGTPYFSNGFFLSSIVLMVIAVIPIFSDVGTSGTAIRKAKFESKPIQQRSAERAAKDLQNWRKTLLYGLAGFTAFLLAIFVPFGS